MRVKKADINSTSLVYAALAVLVVIAAAALIIQFDILDKIKVAIPDFDSTPYNPDLIVSSKILGNFENILLDDGDGRCIIVTESRGDFYGLQPGNPPKLLWRQANKGWDNIDKEVPTFEMVEKRKFADELVSSVGEISFELSGKKYLVMPETNGLVINGPYNLYLRVEPSEPGKSSDVMSIFRNEKWEALSTLDINYANYKEIKDKAVLAIWETKVGEGLESEQRLKFETERSFVYSLRNFFGYYYGVQIVYGWVDDSDANNRLAKVETFHFWRAPVPYEGNMQLEWKIVDKLKDDEKYLYESNWERRLYYYQLKGDLIKACRWE